MPPVEVPSRSTLQDFTVVIVTAYAFKEDTQFELKCTLKTGTRVSPAFTTPVFPVMSTLPRSPGKLHVWTAMVCAVAGAELKYDLCHIAECSTQNSGQTRKCFLRHPVVVICVRDAFDAQYMSNRVRPISPIVAALGTTAAVELDPRCANARTVEEFCAAFAAIPYPKDEEQMPAFAGPFLAQAVRGAWEVDGLTHDGALARQFCFAAVVTIRSSVPFHDVESWLADVRDGVRFASELLLAAESHGSVKAGALNEKLDKWLRRFSAGQASDNEVRARIARTAAVVLGIRNDNPQDLPSLSDDEKHSLAATSPSLLRGYLLRKTFTLRDFFTVVARHPKVLSLDNLPSFLQRCRNNVSDEEFVDIVQAAEEHKHEGTLREVVFGHARRRTRPVDLDDPLLWIAVKAAYAVLPPDAAWGLCQHHVSEHLDDWARGNAERLWEFAEFCEDICEDWCEPLVGKVCDRIVGHRLFPSAFSGVEGLMSRLEGLLKRCASSRLTLVDREKQFLAENLPKAFQCRRVLYERLVADRLTEHQFVSQTLIAAPLAKELSKAVVDAKREFGGALAMCHLLESRGVSAQHGRLIIAALADERLRTQYGHITLLLTSPGMREAFDELGGGVLEDHACVTTQTALLAEVLAEDRASQAEVKALGACGALGLLARVNPTFDLEGVLGRARAATATVHRLLRAAINCAETVMRGMPMFQACAEPFAKRKQNRLDALDTTPIRDLTAGAFKQEDALSIQTVRLGECLKCPLYAHLWNDASCSGESSALPADATDAEVADALIAAEHKATQVFEACVGRFVEGAATVHDLEVAVSLGCPQVETSIALEHSRDAFRKHVEAAHGAALDDVGADVNGIFSLYLHYARDGTESGRRAADARVRAVSDVQKVAQAMWLRDDVEALLGLVDELRKSDADCVVSRDSVHALHVALAKFAGGGCGLQTVLEAHDKLHGLHGHAFSTGMMRLFWGGGGTVGCRRGHARSTSQHRHPRHASAAPCRGLRTAAAPARARGEDPRPAEGGA